MTMIPENNERICLCDSYGIDSKCVHLGGLRIGHPGCDCYSCEEARGEPHTEHVSAFEKNKGMSHEPV